MNIMNKGHFSNDTSLYRRASYVDLSGVCDKEAPHLKIPCTQTPLERIRTCTVYLYMQDVKK